MKLAIDVSKWQGGHKVKDGEELSGVVVRTSDSIEKDPLFLTNVRLYKEFPIAVYHYYRNNWNTDLQVHVTYSQMQEAEKILGYLPHFVLDYEDSVGLNIVGNSTSIKRLYDFVNKIEEKIGEKIWIYTSKRYWNELFTKYYQIRYKKIFRELTSRKLWLAWYFTNDVLSGDYYKFILNKIEMGFKPTLIPAGFTDFGMWQFGKTNEILEYSHVVDVNVIYDSSLFEYGDEPSPEPEPTLEERVERLEKCCFDEE